MKRFREWSASLPAVQQFIVLAIVVAVAWLVIGSIRGHTSVVTALIIGVIFSALFTPVAIARRKVVGSIRMILELSAAIRVGALPDELDASRWLVEVDRRRRWTIQLAILGGGLILAAGGFVAWALLSPQEVLAHSLSAALFAACGLYLAASSLLRLPAIRRVRALIELRSTRVAR